MLRTGIFLGIVAVFVIITWLLVRQSASLTSNPTAQLPTVVATAVLPTFSLPSPSNTNTPAPQPTTPISSNPPTPNPTTHTIQAGDTLFSIALRYDVNLDELAAANGIVDLSYILVGQILTLPQNQPLETTVEPPPQSNQNSTAPVVDTAITQGPPPVQTQMNGLPISSFIIMPPDVVENSRAIYAQGKKLGRNAHAFSKVGDSTIQNPFFLARFDEPGGYNLGEYTYLQPTIGFFEGSHGRQGTAVRIGLHSWTVNDPQWADKSICQSGETPLTCEIRLHNPAILLIRLGSNDAGVPDMFGQNIRQVIELAIANGIIPVIGTKADRFEGNNINNEILRQLAAEYRIPLWDFDVAAQSIPGRGLGVDHVHLTTFYAHDYTSLVAFQRGHGVHNLTALMMLDALLQNIMLPVEAEP